MDARGLAYEVDAPDTQIGRDLIVSMRRKDIRESSFGFVCGRDQWTDNPDGTVTRRILEIEQLIDVSPVSDPAYLRRPLESRSVPDSMPAEYRSRFSKGSAKRSNDNGCDCDCDPCMSGNCLDCSEPACVDPECRCHQRSATISDSERRKMSMRLALATIGK